MQWRSIWHPCSFHGYVTVQELQLPLFGVCLVNLLLKAVDVSVDFVYVTKEHA